MIECNKFIFKCWNNKLMSIEERKRKNTIYYFLAVAKAQ